MFEHGYALLIGVDQNKIPSLALPIVKKDITRLAEVISHPDRCGYPEDHITVVTGPEATRARILAAFEELRTAVAEDDDPNQTVLVYYSGHGHREASGRSFLIPYDVAYPLRSNAISAEDFAESIATLQPRRLLVVLDCCHAESLEVKDTTPSGLSSIAVTADSPGLSGLASGEGRAILSSSRGTQKSWIRTDGAMSVFTYHLVEALTGYAGRPDLPQVTVTEVMDYVGRNVPASAREQHQAEQEPAFRFTGTAFPIALVLGGKGIPAGAAAPSPAEKLPLPVRIRASLKVGVVEGEATGVRFEGNSADIDARTEAERVAPGGRVVGVDAKVKL